MDQIAVQIQSADAERQLTRLPPRIQSALRNAVADLTTDLAAGVRSSIANIFQSDGPLYQSIGSQVDSSNDSEVGTVYSRGVVYAAAQEYGGTWEIPEIFPVNKQALAFGAPAKLGFSSGGMVSETIFAKHTKAHPVTLPARSYARSTLFRMRGQIVDEITAAVSGSIEE